jgi:hypothetical protein
MFRSHPWRATIRYIATCPGGHARGQLSAGDLQGPPTSTVILINLQAIMQYHSLQVP